MRQKFFTALLVLNIVLFTASAWPDFGSFSGNSDYSTSRSSTRSSSSSSSSSSSTRTTSTPSRTYTPTPTRTRTTAPSVPLTAGIAANSLRQSTGPDRDTDDFDDDDFATCMGIGFVFLIFFMYWMFTRKKAKKTHTLNVDENVRILNPMPEYLQLDPEFDEERIKTLMANLYVQMQDTWHAKDISSLRPYMTDAFYSQMDRQLDQFRKMGRTDFTENIAVLNVSLRGWRQASGMDYVTVALNSRITSYTLDDRTGEVLSGDRKREKFMEYEIELCRKSGTITSPESEGQKSAVCPHCGAPLKVNASARCEYCGSVITDVNADWAICGMRGISQRNA